MAGVVLGVVDSKDAFSGFGDYWRIGLPLQIIIVAVSIPAILVFWPL